MSQTPAIINWIATELGMLPDGEEDKARANEIVLMCLDIFNAGANAFHPKICMNATMSETFWMIHHVTS